MEEECNMGNSKEPSSSEVISATPVIGLAKDFIKEPDPVRELALDLYAAGLEHLGKSRAIAELLIAAGYSKNVIHSDTDLREARAAELDDFVLFMHGPHSRLLDTYTRRKFTEEASRRTQELRKA
jgi:hypothetical protein